LKDAAIAAIEAQQAEDAEYRKFAIDNEKEW
jgi:hypothetical protein